MNVITKEVAERDFERFCELNFIEHDPTEFKPEDLEQFNQLKSTVVKAICRGWLTIDDQGLARFTPQASSDKTEIVFYRPTGATLIESDRRKEHEKAGKMIVMLGSLTKQPPNRFATMEKNPDLNVCQAVATLFLA